MWPAIYMLIGAAIGIGSLVGVAVFQHYRDRRRKRRADSLMKVLRRDLPKIEHGEDRLWEALKDTRDIRMLVERKSGAPLSEEEIGSLMLVKGLDTLIRKSDVDWRAVDSMIQKAMDYALKLHHQQTEREPG